VVKRLIHSCPYYYSNLTLVNVRAFSTQAHSALRLAFHDAIGFSTKGMSSQFSFHFLSVNVSCLGGKSVVFTSFTIPFLLTLLYHPGVEELMVPSSFSMQLKLHSVSSKITLMGLETDTMFLPDANDGCNLFSHDLLVIVI